MSTLLLLLTLLAAPGEFPIDPDQRIEPIVTRDAYMDCCRELGVVDDQIPIAELLYEDYLTGLMELQASSIDRAKAAGSEELEAAFQGQSSLRSDELRALRIAVMRSRELNWSGVDALQQMLIDGTVAIGVTGEDADVQSTLRSMQRRVVQEHARRSGSSTDYAGEGFDLVAVAESEQDGMLIAVQGETLDSIIDTWRSHATQLMIMHGPQERTASIERRIADINRDAEAAKMLMAARAERWRPLHEINAWAIESIAQLLAPSGGDVEWRTRARAQLYPWLYVDDIVDRTAAWVLRNGNPEQQEQAGRTLEAYRLDRNTVRRSIEALVVQARLEHGIVLGSPAAGRVPDAQDVQRAWLQATGELQLLKGRADDQLKAMLTPGQLAAVKRSLRD
jgi:hypothetical protein